jgi:apolipoprotein N-acyltransferase
MLSLEKVLPPEIIEEPQRRFRDRVREFCSGVWRKTFSNRDEFAKILVGVLMAWALSEKRSMRRTEVLAWGFLALGALLVLSLPWLDNNVSRAFVAGVVAMIAVVLLGFAGQNLIRMVRR